MKNMNLSENCYICGLTMAPVHHYCFLVQKFIPKLDYVYIYLLLKGEPLTHTCTVHGEPLKHILIYQSHSHGGTLK